MFSKGREFNHTKSLHKLIYLYTERNGNPHWRLTGWELFPPGMIQTWNLIGCHLKRDFVTKYLIGYHFNKDLVIVIRT